MKKVLLLRAFLVIGVFYLTIAPPASAGIEHALYERWDSAGSAESMLTESLPPDYTEILTSTEWGVGDDNALSNYRGRITAWLIPPVTGEYIFWIVTDDNGRLWLSTDHDPNNAQLIALESSWAAENSWGGEGDEAQSSPITLEGGKPYWLRGGYQESGGGDHIRIAWGSNDAGIEAHTIITGQSITDDPEPFYFYAYDPKPTDGAVNVKVENVQLSWQGPVLVNDPVYTVYFGTDANDLPLLAEDLIETTTSAGDLETDTAYSWRVDVFDPNEGGNPAVNVGPVWSFRTTPASPVIFVQPQPVEALVFAGETAIFTIDAYSANDEPLTYAWFKETEPGAILSDTDTLTITEAQIDDEGAYMCTVSNAYGQVTSEPANLFIKRLIGYWPFDDNLDDIIVDNDGTRSGLSIYETGIIPVEGGTEPGSAVKFELGKNSNAVEIPTAAHINLSWTLSFWENSNPDEMSEASWEIMIASGATNGYEILDAGRYAASRYYLGIMLSPFEYDYPRDFVLSTRGQWHLLVITYDSVTKQAILYADGVARIKFDVNFTGFDEVFFVGNSREDYYPYSGLIDDLKFYNYALEPLEIAHFYTDVIDVTVCLQNPTTDISGMEGKPDCVVDIYDLVEVAASWLECNRVPVEDCL